MNGGAVSRSRVGAGRLKTISQRRKPFDAIPFMVFLSGGKDEVEAAFLVEQKQFLSGTFQVDEATGLMIYVPHFQHMLARVNVPVLAIFGEKDRNVNWRNTVPLYSETIGKNPNASLTIKPSLIATTIYNKPRRAGCAKCCK